MQKNSIAIKGSSYLEKSNSKNASENIMEIIGEGTISTQPDIVTIELGVQTLNEDLIMAKNENAESTIKVIEGLLDMGVDQKDIQTINYTVNRQYDYIDGKRVDKGYMVSNILRVTIRDTSIIGEIIDGAMENGANVIRRITFDLSNENDYYLQSLDLALEDAIEKAMSMGEKIEVKVDRIPTKIVEEPYRQVKINRSYQTNGDMFDTPIETGEIDIIAKIKAIFVYDK